MPELSFCTLNPYPQYTALLPRTHLLTQPVFSPGSPGQPSALDPMVKWDWKYLSICNGLFWNPGPETLLRTLPNLPFHGCFPNFSGLLGHWLPEFLTLVSSSGPSSPLTTHWLRYITQTPYQSALLGTIYASSVTKFLKSPPSPAQIQSHLLFLPISLKLLQAGPVTIWFWQASEIAPDSWV